MILIEFTFLFQKMNFGVLFFFFLRLREFRSIFFEIALPEELNRLSYLVIGFVLVGASLDDYSKIRNKDVEAMCDLAMYNYIEVVFILISCA